MEEVVQKILESNLILSAIVIIISYLIYRILSMIIGKGAKSKRILGKKLTYIRLLDNILKYFFLIVTILIILQVNDFNVSSLIAGLGIAGIIVGLAVQDLIKDVIGGFNIITDDVFSVGDVIKYNGVEGKVISLGLKNTKIRDIYTNNMYIIANGNIKEILNISEWNEILIPASYDAKIEKMDEVLNKVVQEIKGIENVKDCDYLGICGFEQSSISYKIRIFCRPEHKLITKRKALRCVKLALDNNNLKIPYQQIDIHTKN